jgi:hypothetical protein
MWCCLQVVQVTIVHVLSWLIRGFVVTLQNNPLMANMGYDDQHPPAQTPGAISERGVATPWNEDYEFPASVGLVSAVCIVCIM